jgi:hypothetical protein
MPAVVKDGDASKPWYRRYIHANTGSRTSAQSRCGRCSGSLRIGKADC